MSALEKNATGPPRKASTISLDRRTIAESVISTNVRRQSTMHLTQESFRSKMGTADKNGLASEDF